jgi:hypothetical protein
MTAPTTFKARGWYVDALTGLEWGHYDAGTYGWPDAASLRKRLRQTCQFWHADVFIDLSSLHIGVLHVIEVRS